ncbi:MAG: polysaccharide deacetylase family protein [Saprospiraceae bacterium]|nr:polysaccharide deacetylase family protein [Saprospiraceae bacterium]
MSKSSTVITMPILALFTWIILTATPVTTINETAFEWPNGAKAAICLTYDDGLPSHIQTVAPALKKHGLRATFYPTMASESIQAHMAQWRQLAIDGHELGNHSLYHPCQKSEPDMDWVPDWYDLDQYSLQQLLGEVKVANTFLQALDGQESRSFAYPCGHFHADGEDFTKPLQAHNSAARDASESQLALPSIEEVDLFHIPSWAPNGHDAKALIDYVEKVIEQQTLSSFTFHGVGAEHMQISVEAHESLLEYLVKNEDKIWVTTIEAAANYLQKHRK